jgi:hypothetical protein
VTYDERRAFAAGDLLASRTGLVWSGIVVTDQWPAVRQAIGAAAGDWLALLTAPNVRTVHASMPFVAYGSSMAPWSPLEAALTIKGLLRKKPGVEIETSAAWGLQFAGLLCIPRVA